MGNTSEEKEYPGKEDRNPAWKGWSLRLKQCPWDPPLKMTVQGLLTQRQWIILFQSFARQRWNPLTSTLPLPLLPRLTVKPMIYIVSGLVFGYIRGVGDWRKREWLHTGVNVGQVGVRARVSHRIKIKKSEVGDICILTAGSCYCWLQQKPTQRCKAIILQLKTF